MGSTGAEEQHLAQQWLSQALDALTADDLWTRLLSASHMDTMESETTAILGDHLQYTWERLTSPHALDTLERFLLQYRDQGVETARAAESEAVETLGLAERDRFTEHARRAIAALVAIRETEKDALADKVERVRTNTWTPGDFSPTARCALLLAATLAAFALAQLPIGAFLAAWFGTAKCGSVLIHGTTPPGE